MKNSSTKISASEINRYTYCPYQWYYERFYGRNELFRIHKQRLKELGLLDKSQSNLLKGTRFHNSYLRRDLFKRAIRVLLIILFAACLSYIIIKVYL